MPARVSECFVLRTYPLREADLIVSFLSRDQGKLRGVARRARQPGSRFGGRLERLTQARLYYWQKETRELVRIDACELIRSPFEMQQDYPVAVALDYVAEVAEQLLAPGEPNERYYRLLCAVVDYLAEKGSEGVWPAVLYYTLWAVKLSGFLPELETDPAEGEVAREMLRTHIRELKAREWNKSTAEKLRRQLIGLIESHVERPLVSVPVLEAL